MALSMLIGDFIGHYWSFAEIFVKLVHFTLRRGGGGVKWASVFGSKTEFRFGVKRDALM